MDPYRTNMYIEPTAPRAKNRISYPIMLFVAGILGSCIGWYISRPFPPEIAVCPPVLHYTPDTVRERQRHQAEINARTWALSYEDPGASGTLTHCLLRPNDTALCDVDIVNRGHYTISCSVLSSGGCISN